MACIYRMRYEPCRLSCYCDCFCCCFCRWCCYCCVCELFICHHLGGKTKQNKCISFVSHTLNASILQPVRCFNSKIEAMLFNSLSAIIKLYKKVPTKINKITKKIEITFEQRRNAIWWWDFFQWHFSCNELNIFELLRSIHSENLFETKINTQILINQLDDNSRW